MKQVPKVLTVNGVERAEPKEARYERPDAGLPGFYLIVQPTGAKSFAVRYRAAGKPKKLTIGSYPQLTLEAARKLARDAFADLARGKDPAQEKAARKHSTGLPETVDDLAKLFLERHAKVNTREGSWRKTESILNRDVLPKWKGRRLDSLHRRDVIALLGGIAAERPISANSTLAVLRKMFNWSVEQVLLENSPCFQVKAPRPKVSRDRVLTDDELRAVWQAAERLEAPFGPYLQMLTLTLQRRNEVSGMRWSELDLKAKTWTLPENRTKNKQEHIVPLPNAAMAILETLPRGTDLVFTTTGRAPIAGFGKCKRRLDALIAEESGSPIASWRFHDLRRTGASKMPRFGVDLPTVEKLLNHTSGSFGGVVGTYQRHSFLDEKRDALERWAAFLDRLTDGGGNVIPLPLAR